VSGGGPALAAEMRGIGKRYGVTAALQGVNLTGVAGEVHALVGENGAGKSTLMKVLSGAVQPDEGEIRLNGTAVRIDGPAESRRLGVHAVYQDFSLVPNLSVAENIWLHGGGDRGRRWWVDWPQVNSSAQHLLDEIGFKGVDVRVPISRLRVSVQQMVEIAQAVVERPRILILDEPSAVLSWEELHRLFGLVRRLAAEGTLVFYVSHRLEEVFEIADRITVLKDGEVVGTVRPQEADQQELIRMMVGRRLEEIFPRRGGPRGEEVLGVDRLSRDGAFADLSFTLGRGEIVGVFGLVGSGRTEMARCIFGAEPITSGEMRLEGQPYGPRSPAEAVTRGVAYLTEDRARDGLVLTDTIRDNVSLASLRRFGRWGLLDRKAQEEAVKAKVREVGVRPPQPSQVVDRLSGGNQQKVMLAKWLLTEAKVLMLDEPTRGVDVATKVDIYRRTAALAERGVGILLISSELPEILGMSERILVMRGGRVVGEFDRARATEEALLASASGVRS
jgi:ribose transport system ATP-binding protein